MSIIVEGCDRCGKTTVANKLREMMRGYYYYHHTKPPMDPFNYFGRFFATASPMGVVDRCHFSEVAYGHTYRHQTQLNRHTWRLLELMIQSQQTQVIHLTDDLQAIEGRWSTKEMFDSSGIDTLLAYYNRIAMESKLNVKTYRLPELVDAKGNTSSILKELVNKEMELQFELPMVRMLPALAIGGNYGFVILGDTPSGKYGADGGVPAPWIYGDSSEWVWTAVDKANAPSHCGFYTNASAFWSPVYFKDYMEYVVKPEKIICLGNNAYEMVTQSGWKGEFVKVLHPSAAKRFGGVGAKDEWMDSVAQHLVEWKVSPEAILLDPTRSLEKSGLHV